LLQKSLPCVAEDIFSILSDDLSSEILNAAHTGLKSSSKGLNSQSKKQYYVRLRRLADMGIIEKDRSVYKLTTFGSLIYENHFKTLEKLLHNYWQIKSIDVLKFRNDFPSEKKENIINEYIITSGLCGLVNATQLTSYNTVYRFEQLIPEVMKVLDNAENEIYFATRYYDPHVSKMVFEKFSKGVTIHILDGNPDQITVENRLGAILRTPPNRETGEIVKKLLKSPKFDLKRLPSLPLSFIVVDQIQVVYESINFANPDQFTIAVSKYDDSYFAQRFIRYFNLLYKNSSAPELLMKHRTSPLR